VHARAVPVGAARARGFHAGGHRRPADAGHDAGTSPVGAARVHAAGVVDDHARAHIGIGAYRFHDDEHVDDNHDSARVVDHDDETVSRPLVPRL
jgi:hypothetical protein